MLFAMRLSFILLCALLAFVAAKAESENELLKLRPGKTWKKGRIDFKRYLRYDEINAYLDQLANKRGVVTVKSAGKSYEGREMKYVRISSRGSKGNKPTIFIDAGMHSNEWMAPAFALYIINELVENQSNSRLIKDVNWIVLPIANPDGYVYTWTKNRSWGKTRSKGKVCYGSDPVRNFGFHWMEVGASSFECSETYAGPKAFSEIETRNIRDLIVATENIKVYLTVHSYGQYLLTPWGYTSTLPANYNELKRLGENVSKAIAAVKGTKYTVGTKEKILNATAGSAEDWAMGVVGINITYMIKLPRGGDRGYNAPPSDILPVCVETFEGIKVLHDYVAKN